MQALPASTAIFAEILQRVTFMPHLIYSKNHDITFSIHPAVREPYQCLIQQPFMLKTTPKQERFLNSLPRILVGSMTFQTESHKISKDNKPTGFQVIFPFWAPYFWNNANPELGTLLMYGVDVEQLAENMAWPIFLEQLYIAADVRQSSLIIDNIKKHAPAELSKNFFGGPLTDTFFAEQSGQSRRAIYQQRSKTIMTKRQGNSSLEDIVNALNKNEEKDECVEAEGNNAD